MNGRLSTIVPLALLWITPLQAQERDIQGQVTSVDQGAPLADAIVQVVGTAFGTLTDPDGTFLIRAPAGDV